jgi:uncharacterized NAD-dependent epimerase/dehydratase family protein
MNIEIPRPYLLFLGDITDAAFAKTALGLRDWARDSCIGECALPAATVTTGLPRVTPAEGYARGARALVIGIANRGGVISPGWIPMLLDALEAGLDIVSGLHDRLYRQPDLDRAAKRLGRRLIDVRQPPPDIPIATGEKRAGKRLLTVGTDCALGKKYTALTLARAFKKLGLPCDFRATGQTGIMISGSGIPMDAMVADFASGAAELLSPAASDDHWDVIEGQGSLFHPSYAGVSLSLLHGSQPDVIVMCHEWGRDRMVGLEAFPTPGLTDAIDLNLRLAGRTNPAVRCAGVSLNTAHLSQDDARAALEECSEQLHLPVADPIRGGPAFDALVAACLGK